jgi:hypothetical protein
MFTGSRGWLADGFPGSLGPLGELGSEAPTSRVLVSRLVGVGVGVGVGVEFVLAVVRLRARSRARARARARKT